MRGFALNFQTIMSQYFHLDRPKTRSTRPTSSRSTPTRMTRRPRSSCATFRAPTCVHSTARGGASLLPSSSGSLSPLSSQRSAPILALLRNRSGPLPSSPLEVPSPCASSLAPSVTSSAPASSSRQSSVAALSPLR